MTVNLVGGQDVLTVPTMQAKLAAQLHGLGGGFLPEPMARPYIEAGHLVERRTERVLPVRHDALRLARAHRRQAGPRAAVVARAVRARRHAPRAAGTPPRA